MTTDPALGIEYRHCTAGQARTLRSEVEQIFRGAYVEAIESGESFEAPAAFMHRFDAYTNPDREFELVMALVDGNPVAQAWGWPLGADSRWWGGLQLDDSAVDFTTENGRRTFALSEIMVRQDFAGRGIARALHKELLEGRSEQRATLLVRPDNRRAYDTYLRWGWYRVGVLRPGWPDAPQFDVLIRDLSAG